MDILANYTPQELQTINIDLSRPGFAFILAILQSREQHLREVLKRRGPTKENDLAALESWRATLADLEAIKSLPSLISETVANAFNGEESEVASFKSPPMTPAAYL